MRWTLCVLIVAMTSVLAGPIDDARSLAEQSRSDEASSLLERVIEDPRTDPGEKQRALELRTKIANDRRNYKKGVDWGKRAISASPRSSNAHYQYAIALRNKMQVVNGMRSLMIIGGYRRALERAIQLDGDNVEARLEQIDFLTSAPGFAGGSISKARIRASELHPIDGSAGVLAMARVEVADGKPEEAAAICRQWLERNEQDAAVRFELALNYQARQLWTRADREFARLSGGDDEPAHRALFQRARTRILGRYEQQLAIGFLEEYLRRIGPDADPSASVVWWRIGTAQEQLEQYDAARRAYSESLRLDENHRRAAKALKRLERR